MRVLVLERQNISRACRQADKFFNRLCRAFVYRRNINLLFRRLFLNGFFVSAFFLAEEAENPCKRRGKVCYEQERDKKEGHKESRGSIDVKESKEWLREHSSCN